MAEYGRVNAHAVVSPIVSHASALPWSASAPEDRRFAAITVAILALFLPLALAVPILEVPEAKRAEAERVPPQLARLIDRPEPVKPPKVSMAEPKPAPKPEPEPKPIAAETTKPEPPVVKSRPERQAAPATELSPQTAEQAREKASRSGLLAMKDRLASLRTPTHNAPEVLQANSSAVASHSAATISRAQATRGSGGVIDDKGPEAQVAVQGHQVKTVQVTPEARAHVANKRSAEPSVGERAMSNIRKVFDAQKTALYSLYRRELRQDPSLEGKLLLELVIEPDGSVSACQVVSSELGNPPLEQRIAMRVRLFNFGADDVKTRKVRFPIDFLPG